MNKPSLEEVAKRGWILKGPDSSSESASSFLSKVSSKDLYITYHLSTPPTPLSLFLFLTCSYPPTAPPLFHSHSAPLSPSSKHFLYSLSSCLVFKSSSSIASPYFSFTSFNNFEVGLAPASSLHSEKFYPSSHLFLHFLSNPFHI